MRSDVLVRGRQERRIEPMIDGIRDRRHRAAARRKSFDDLALTHAPVRQVLLKNSLRVVDRVAVCGKQSDGAELPDTFERRQVLAQFSAAAGVNHHAAAADDEVARECGPGRRIPEHQMIW